MIMSMEHKAFLFHSQKYEREIEKVIEQCCSNDGKQYAMKYINKNYHVLKSPYTGEELNCKWEEEIETDTIQEYVDFILTACYDPNEDIGLGYEWEYLIEILKKLNISDSAEPWILGNPISYHGIIIDPGGMGLGIINVEQVGYIRAKLINSQKRIKKIEIDKDLLNRVTKDEILEAYNDLCDIYQFAEEQGSGILMTF